MRSLTTIPLLRISRILYVFLPVLNEPLEKYWALVYAFAIILPHILNYFGSKLIRSMLKINHHVIIFSRETYTINKNLLHMGIIFLVFLIIYPLILPGELELFKILSYPFFIMISIGIYDLFRKVKKVLLSFSSLGCSSRNHPLKERILFVDLDGTITGLSINNTFDFLKSYLYDSGLLGIVRLHLARLASGALNKLIGNGIVSRKLFFSVIYFWTKKEQVIRVCY